MGLLDRLFGRSNVSRDGGIYVAVRCDACGEIIRARINPLSELSQSDEGEGYFVRKVLVGQKCFRSIELQIRFADLKGKVISEEVHGGTIVPASDAA